MGHDSLSHLALLCIERAYIIREDTEKATDEFLPKKLPLVEF